MAELREVASGSATQGLCLRNGKVRSQVSPLSLFWKSRFLEWLFCYFQFQSEFKNFPASFLYFYAAGSTTLFFFCITFSPSLHA